MLDLAFNLAQVRARVARAAARAGRDPESIELVAVTKGCGAEVVRGLWSLGLRDFGESRVQEALPKMGLELPGARWHLIGHLQENKINKILPGVYLVQSVDSLQLGQALASRAERLRRRLPVLVEVKTSPEATKHGVGLEAAEDVYGRLAELPALEPAGLMTLAPFDDPAGARRSFQALRRIFEHLKSAAVPPRVLSMGMSDDFEIAIEEGSTMVRVGRALTVG